MAPPDATARRKNEEGILMKSTISHAVATCVACAMLIACNKSSDDNRVSSGSARAPTPRSDSPTNGELIDAVVRAAANDKKTTTRHRHIERTHVCSEYDVARDPYMPKNPELAKCPRVGRRYSVRESQPYTEEVRCPALPTSHGAWTVTRLRDDQWRLRTYP